MSISRTIHSLNGAAPRPVGAIARAVPPSRRIRFRPALDALALAFVFAFLPEVILRPDALQPVPAWLAVAVLAARGGGGGMLTGLIACSIGLGLGSLVSGAGFAAPFTRVGTTADLAAFAACLAVSWVAAWHLRRHALLSEELASVSDRAAHSESMVGTLHDVVVALRSRVDRVTTSLTFLRDVASRLEGGDAHEAAEAAAELALLRSGANAVQVHMGVGGTRQLLAERDVRGSRGIAPLSPCDAERVVSIGDGHRQLGSITLWGIPRGGTDEVIERDLEIVASWCAPALDPTCARVNTPRIRLVERT